MYIYFNRTKNARRKAEIELWKVASVSEQLSTFVQLPRRRVDVTVDAYKVRTVNCYNSLYNQYAFVVRAFQRQRTRHQSTTVLKLLYDLRLNVAKARR